MGQGCKVIQLGDSTAIMCGGKGDHECDSAGEGVLLLSSGKRVSSTNANQEKYGREITGGSVTCSICGRAAIDNAMQDMHMFDEEADISEIAN